MTGDGVLNDADNCCHPGTDIPFAYNPDQADAYRDGIGDACPYFIAEHPGVYEVAPQIEILGDADDVGAIATYVSTIQVGP